MKNKLNLIFLFLICVFNAAQSEVYNFETKNIEIKSDEEIILAGKGVVTSSSKTKIFANNFEYKKKISTLKAYGDGSAISELEQFEIIFENAIFNDLLNTIDASGNVILNYKKNKLLIKSEKIFYDVNEKKIKSDKKTLIEDNNGNIYKVDNFIFEINDNLLKVKNLELTDINGNKLTTELAYINTNSNKLFGKDAYFELDNFSINKKNEPRLKGRTILDDDRYSKIAKGVFTTCKKTDDCPPWEFSSDEITYDKKNEVIIYKDSILRLYDVPVMYFPKFFHPSPNVKRKSGFLIPSIENTSASGNYLNLPYFHVISENKDVTVYPRFFGEEKLLLQTEYRQINKNSNQIADLSYFKDNKGNQSKSHFFYNLFKEFDFDNSNKASLSIKTQHTSNDTYFRTSKIKSEIQYDENVLDNSINLNIYSEDLKIDLNTSMYENLSLDTSDRYEYILPKINLSKKINNKTNLNGTLFFNSEILARNYNTNSFTKYLYNELNFQSAEKQSQFGLLSNHQILLKNLNSRNQKTGYKDNGNEYFSGIYQFNSSLPLIKNDKDMEKILLPKLSFKISPQHTKNSRNENTKIDINNIYSINRLSGKNTNEGGPSLTYGADYSIFKKSKKIFDLQLANNFRLKKNDDIQNQNQMGEKTSNFFGAIRFSPNKFLDTEYNMTLKNNLSDINEENLLAKINLGKFDFSFDYQNQNFGSDNLLYITNQSNYLIDENNIFSFSTRKNKTKDLTEYYNFMYRYKNDCLAASIEYNKNFYNDRDVMQNENLIFKLTIIPLGTTSSPNFGR